MITIQLPFFELFVCEVCGFSSHKRERLGECLETPIREKPDVRVDEMVSIYENAWKGEKFVASTKTPTPYTVVEFFYAKPFGNTLVHHPKEVLETHQLCLWLCQTIVGEKRSPWRKGDKEGRLEVSMTYRELLFRRKGGLL